MILLLGGIKGGSGRTTVATNLSVQRSSKKDVLLVDADDQETSSDFTILRNEQTDGNAGYTCIKLTGSAVRTETLRIADKYDDVIIDTGGRDTTSQRAAMSIADEMLIPFVPRSFDIWTIEKVVEMTEEMRSVNPKLNASTFLNRADPRGKDNGDAEKIITEYEGISFLPCALGNRKAFGNAAAAGLAVTEVRPRDPKAIKEITHLYQRVFKIK